MTDDVNIRLTWEQTDDLFDLLPPRNKRADAIRKALGRARLQTANDVAEHYLRVMAARSFTPTAKSSQGFRSIPAYHDRVPMAELAKWVTPRDNGFTEPPFIDLEDGFPKQEAFRPYEAPSASQPPSAPASSAVDPTEFHLKSDARCQSGDCGHV